MSISIYYDGDCPFCTNYTQLLRLRESVGPVRLVDLREDAEARERLTALGLDLDKGMAVETGDVVYHGAEAMNALSLMSSGSGPLDRLVAAIFRHKAAATLLYPLLRAGRNATLFFLGRQPIRERQPAQAALFEIFARVFGLFVFLHASYLLASPFTGHWLLTAILLPLGGFLFLRPQSRRIFLFAIAALAVDSFVRAPVFSNHTILQNFLLVTMLAAGLWYWLRGESWDRFFEGFAPVGRCFLLTMYSFGIFHKINSDFLNPEVSCAVALWRMMPEPLSWIDNAPMHYLAIYGTFAVEGGIMLMLLVPRWRHFGIIGGIGFHGLLALSRYARYASFSTLSIALHTLFLSPATALRITSSPAYRRFDSVCRSPIGVTVLAILLSYFLLANVGQVLHLAIIVWVLLILGPAIAIIAGGWTRVPEDGQRNFLWSRAVPLNLLTLAFFINCAAPFMGLKTAQSMNMFANIRMEGGAPNHLIFSTPPGPFPYLKDVVQIQGATGAPQLNWLADRADIGLVYYDFLNRLERTPEALVSFTLNGIEHRDVRAADLLARDGGMLHSSLARKYFHFKPVPLDRPVRCNSL